MGQGDMDGRGRQFAGAVLGNSMQADRWNSARIAHHLDVAPGNAASQVVAGERLEGRLLGREAHGRVLGGQRLASDVVCLPGGKQPFVHPVAQRGNHAVDPLDLDDVDPDTSDHQRLTADSIVTHDRSADSNTRWTLLAHARHRPRSSTSLIARAAACSRSVSATVSWSDASDSSASSARRRAGWPAARSAAKSRIVAVISWASRFAPKAAMTPPASRASIDARRAAIIVAKNRAA